jgi:hypothetical protein
MSHQISHPNLGLAIYGALCCVGVAAFAAWMHGVLQPTSAQNPGLAAYKPPPATIVGYRPAVILPAPWREALTVVEIGPEPAGKQAAAEAAGPTVLQHPSDVNHVPVVDNIPVQATTLKEAAKMGSPKRQRSARRNETKPRTNEFAFQPLFGGFRPWN